MADRSRAGIARDFDAQREIRRARAEMSSLQKTVEDAAAADVTLTKIEDVASGTVLMNATVGSAAPTATAIDSLPDMDTSNESSTFLLGSGTDSKVSKLSLQNLRTLLGL